MKKKKSYLQYTVTSILLAVFLWYFSNHTYGEGNSPLMIFFWWIFVVLGSAFLKDSEPKEE